MATSLEPKLAAVRDAVAARRDEIAELASQLVRFDTTARLGDTPPRQERALQEFLGERLRGSGAQVEIWEPEPACISAWRAQVGSDRLSFAGRPQLTARWDGGEGRSLIFNGHIDVVSAEPRTAWSADPFAGRIAEGRVFGRGACDMKGGIAAMVIAAEAVVSECGSPPGTLILNTVTDEESSGAGALACIAAGLSADAVIVPEPTSFDVWVACRGSLTPTIEVSGRPGHAELAQPHWRAGGAVNAIEKLGVVTEAVGALRREWSGHPDHRHPYLSPGTVVPVIVEGGEWFVTYPATARLTCELMYLPGAADSAATDGRRGRRVAEEFQRWIGAASAGDPWLAEHPPRISWGSDIPPAEIEPTHPLAVIVLGCARASGQESAIAGFDSWFDGASFIHAGTPAVAFGPPGVNLAHAIDESVAVDDLVACAQSLAMAALVWGESG